MNINIFKNNAILRGKTPLIGSIIAGILVGVSLLGIVIPQISNADFANIKNASYVVKASNETKKANKAIKVIITAYSSTPEQTDDTPFITASGKTVADGIVANNMLPFGTQIRIPSIFGNKIFVVQDRMNKRKSDYHIDIWFPTYMEAKNFGVKTAEIEVLES
jgi:3D (Asp-Asp-Asp) domain-containing protein